MFSRPFDDERHLPLLEHLEELRTRLIRSAVAVLIGCVVGYFVAPVVIDLLVRPMREAGILGATKSSDAAARVEVAPDGTMKFVPEALAAAKDPPAAPLRLTNLSFYHTGEKEPFARWEAPVQSGIIYLHPIDPMMIRFKTSLILGVIIGLPVILFQLYAFVAPGLLPGERRTIVPLFVAAALLFPLGASFAYFSLKYAILVFAEYATNEVPFMNDMKEYLSFALTTMAVFGVLFEFPIVVVLATRLGIVSVDTLAGKRRMIFVGLLVAAAIATPTGDPVTLLALGLPLYLLFEVSLLVSRFGARPALAEAGSAAGEPTGPSEV